MVIVPDTFGDHPADHRAKPTLAGRKTAGAPVVDRTKPTERRQLNQPVVQ